MIVKDIMKKAVATCAPDNVSLAKTRAALLSLVYPEHVPGGRVAPHRRNGRRECRHEHDPLQAAQGLYGRPLHETLSWTSTSSRRSTVPVRRPRVFRSDDVSRPLPGTRLCNLPSPTARVVASARPSPRRDACAPHDNK